MTIPFWQTNPDAPWATLLAITATYCHPEAWEGAYDQLKGLAATDSPRMTRFKEELQAAVRDPSQLPEGALSYAAAYDDGSETKFLTRLWRDLYPGEPLPS